MNDFQEVNESTKAILRKLAEQTAEGKLTIEFLVEGNLYTGKVHFYDDGNASVVKNTIGLGHAFWFDDKSALSWQTFMVETSLTGRTYENTPLQLVTHWRVAPTSLASDEKQPQKSSEQAKPITDTLPTHLEWHKPEEKPSEVFGKDFYGYQYLVCHGSGEFFSVCQREEYPSIKNLNDGWFCFDTVDYLKTKIIAWARLYPKE